MGWGCGRAGILRIFDTTFIFDSTNRSGQFAKEEVKNQL